MSVGDSASRNDVRRVTVKVGSHVLSASRTSDTALFRNVPLTRGGTVSLELDSGPPVNLKMPNLALAPVLKSEEAVDTEPAQEAWSAVAAAARTPSAPLEPGVEVLKVRKWSLRIWPHYVAMNDGEPDEKGDPVADLLNQAVDSSGGTDQTGFQRLFGTVQPFTVTWSFRGTNVTTGQAVPVRPVERASSTEIGVSLAGLFSKNEVHARFPTRSDAVFRLDGVGSMTDAYGIHGSFHFSIWSHYLSSGVDSLAGKAFAMAARMARKTPDELYRVVAEGDSVPPDGSRASDGRRARMIQMWALQAARDGRVTLDELEQIGRLIAASLLKQ